MLLKIIPSGPDPHKPIWGFECQRYKMKIIPNVDSRNIDEFVREYDVDVVYQPDDEQLKKTFGVQIGGPMHVLYLDWGTERAQSAVIRSSVSVYVVGADGATVDKFGIS